MKSRFFNTLLLIFLFSSPLLLTDCSQDEDPVPSDDKVDDPIDTPESPITSDDISFSVHYYKPFENVFYPSIVLGLANYSDKTDGTLDFFHYNLTSPKDEIESTVIVKSSILNEETVIREKLGIKGTSSEFTPDINWDYISLRSLDKPGNVNVTFSCEMESKEIDRKSITLNYRSINECVYAFKDENNEVVDIKWMFAAYVDEDNTLIDGFLNETLDLPFIDSFFGYQGDMDDVFNQVFAIWYNLQKKGVKYSSITDTSSPDDKVFSQYVRFFDEVLNNEQANCVDGTVFMSSILRKIGIHPILVLIPGHMYLAYYVDSEKTEGVRLLETTMIDDINHEMIYEQGGSLYCPTSYRDAGYLTDDIIIEFYDESMSIEYVRINISWNHFKMATKHHNDDYMLHLDDFADQNNPKYQKIDIESWRQVVQPIGG